MSRFFITGDCHGDFRRLSSRNFPTGKKLSRDDYVIICGDFGYWVPSKDRNYWMNWLSRKRFTVLFVDGNHEDFDSLSKIPTEYWNGGTVQKIRDNVVHLMRGQVYDISGVKFFTFGGARSHDISGGILETSDPCFDEKRRKLDKEDACYRINRVSWWKEEMPNEKEMEEGLKRLEKNDWCVDYIVTHDCPSDILNMFEAGCYKADALNMYFQKVRDTTTYGGWYFGHYHDDRSLTKKDFMIYESIIELT